MYDELPRGKSACVNQRESCQGMLGAQGIILRLCSTQMVWRGTQQIGCAQASCGLWSCRYAPAVILKFIACIASLIHTDMIPVTKAPPHSKPMP